MAVPRVEALSDLQASLILFRNLMDRSNDALEILDSATLRFVDVKPRQRKVLAGLVETSLAA